MSCPFRQNIIGRECGGEVFNQFYLAGHPNLNLKKIRD